ncbi:MAG: Pr6Pr family membrane protein, partial [Alistipes sp.]|nr:Pr6Pr family membrane protein [Candidatus Minthomonas equi]
ERRQTGQLFLALLAFASAAIGEWLALVSDIHNIRFFTHEGNSACALVLFFDLFFVLSGKKLPRVMGVLEYIFMIAILTVGIVYCTLLADFCSAEFWHDPNNVLVHFFTPLFYTAYVLIYRNSSLPEVKSAAWALLPPVLYSGFVLIRHYVFVETLHTVPRWFPYFFMDLDRLGLGGFAMWVAAMAAVIYLAGVLILFFVNYVRPRR